MVICIWKFVLVNLIKVRLSFFELPVVPNSACIESGEQLILQTSFRIHKRTGLLLFVAKEM